ncbi:AAA family ATPase [Virgibacillus necropolis]|uniref:AAA family ATPase n=1 Tax=Virgibacillus necropolis TaxID=163877 RepID=UPI00384D728A
MERSVAKVFTENNCIIEKLKKILQEMDTDFEILDNLSTFIDYSSSSIIIIDQESIQINEDLHIPETIILIVLCSERSFDDVRKWMERGADYVLIVPDELDKLKTIIEDKKTKLNAFSSKMMETSNHNSGKVSAFYSTNGGSGKTLLATMAAQSLQMQHDQRVIVIDLNAQFGGVDVITALEPSRSYADLKPVIEELSLNHIQNVSQTDPDTGVQILQGPAEPEKAEELTDKLISRVIQTCKFHFDHVILDVPSNLNTISFTGLNEASHIFYILSPDSLSLRGYKHANRVFKRFKLPSHQNMSIILNRKHKKAELTEKSINKLIGKPITGSIKSDFFAIQPFLNMGRPFYNKKGKPLCRSAQNVSRFIEKTLI